MKKRGFTLAEVMVAMALIGVIASLTIPTFISSSRNKANASKLATTVSSIENAFASMITEEDAADLLETDFGRNLSSNSLSKYLKIYSFREGNSDNYTHYYGVETPFTALNGTGYTSSGANYSFQTKNGALLFFVRGGGSFTTYPIARDESTVRGLGGSVATAHSHLIIDVNGNAKPNIIGRDVFWYLVGADGVLYPSGSLNYSILNNLTNTNIWTNSSSAYACTSEKKTTGCTARLVENNYEIDF